MYIMHNIFVHTYMHVFTSCVINHVGSLERQLKVAIKIGIQEYLQVKDQKRYVDQKLYVSLLLSCGKFQLLMMASRNNYKHPIMYHLKSE